MFSQSKKMDPSGSDNKKQRDFSPCFISITECYQTLQLTNSYAHM